MNVKKENRFSLFLRRHGAALLLTWHLTAGIAYLTHLLQTGNYF